METIEKRFAAAFSESWNSTAPVLMTRASTLKLQSLRQVEGDPLASALAAVSTCKMAFVAPCSSAMTGVVIALFREGELAEIESLLEPETNDAPNSGSRALVNQTLAQASAALSKEAATAFGDAVFFDLSADESLLARIVGERAAICTFTLTVGNDLETQAIVIHAPQGSVETAALKSSAISADGATQMGDATSRIKSPNASDTSRPVTTQQQNIDRLLDVDLDLIVRFGTSHMPLRDVVRMGVGTMIELNRAIDEPVELLINGRQLARGEVVVVNGYYGVRITEICAAAERAASII